MLISRAIHIENENVNLEKGAMEVDPTQSACLRASLGATAIRNMNPFSEQYKSLNNIALLRILERSTEYQPLAVEAAQLELTFRKLSNEELDAEKVGLALEKEREQIARQREISSRIKRITSPLWNYFRTVQIFLNRFINPSLLAQWMIAIGAFISLVAYGFIVGIPMYFMGVIIYWTTIEHVIDKITWTVLPIILFVVLVKMIYVV